MKKSRLCFWLLWFTSILLLFFGFNAFSNHVHAESMIWESIAPGVDFRKFFLAHPNRVYVARMERAHSNLTLDTAIAQGRISGGVETVRAMAERMDKTINYWGEEWGKTNQVVVAVNGYFYDTETGIPWSGQIKSANYVKRFDDLHSGSGLVWTLDRNFFIGGCVRHQPGKQRIIHLPTNQTQTFDGINIPRGEDQMIIYTSDYDATTLTDDNGIEVLVELDNPFMIVPSPDMITGIVVDKRDGIGSISIPVNHIVLSASGTASEGLRSEVHIDDQIGISQEIRHMEADCQTPSSQSWTKTYAGLGASFTFLKDGEIQTFDDLGAILRNPRTAVAYNDRYIFFIVVDGRDRLGSVGMSMVELGVFAKHMLGATWGAALDGGGSSTMVVNDQIVNHPNLETAYDENEPIPADPNQMRMEERAVANSIMMLVVQPEKFSTTFSPGQDVLTASGTVVNVHLGPGTNYALLTTLPAGKEGIIRDNHAGLNGVFAQNGDSTDHWWEVDFGDFKGWVNEGSLIEKGF
jgi:hypothetical protein